MNDLDDSKILIILGIHKKNIKILCMINGKLTKELGIFNTL